MVEKICRATAQNCSSMLQDIQKHKRTEIHFINGAIIREGESAGIACPVNNTLLWLVVTIEEMAGKGVESN